MDLEAVYVLHAFQKKTAATARRDFDMLDVSQPRLNDLLRGRINNFSLDALCLLATRAGLNVRVQIGPIAA